MIVLATVLLRKRLDLSIVYCFIILIKLFTKFYNFCVYCEKRTTLNSMKVLRRLARTWY